MVPDYFIGLFHHDFNSLPFYNLTFFLLPVPGRGQAPEAAFPPL